MVHRNPSLPSLLPFLVLLLRPVWGECGCVCILISARLEAYHVRLPYLPIEGPCKVQSNLAMLAFGMEVCPMLQQQLSKVTKPA